MVSSEGQCRIWHTYGGLPDLRSIDSGPSAPVKRSGSDG
jgi:hypothetical protein